MIAPEAEPPHLQMALDEVLLERLRAGARGPTLRVWEWSQPALVIGSHQSVRNEVDTECAAAAGFTITRRMSGGGTMLAEPGRTVTYSIYAPLALVAHLSLVDSFAFLDAWAVAALRRLGVPAGYRPVNDIVSPEGKIGGAAQARRGTAVLHHTTIAHAMDPDLLGRLIRMGAERVNPIGVRSAVRLVTPLDRYLAIGAHEVTAFLSAAFAAAVPARPGAITQEERAAAAALAREKYGAAAWIERLP
ncbi:MAG: lipoate--protein ligase family protein [Candidatus Dormibacteraceae bacterium]